MQQEDKKLAKKELERIYDARFKWLQVGKMLRGRLSQSLHDNPKLNLVLKLVVFANIGIWISAIILISQVN
jgi:hypothetical protein